MRKAVASAWHCGGWRATVLARLPSLREAHRPRANREDLAHAESDRDRPNFPFPVIGRLGLRRDRDGVGEGVRRRTAGETSRSRPAGRRHRELTQTIGEDAQGPGPSCHRRTAWGPRPRFPRPGDRRSPWEEDRRSHPQMRPPDPGCLGDTREALRACLRGEAGDHRPRPGRFRPARISGKMVREIRFQSSVSETGSPAECSACTRSHRRRERCGSRSRPALGPGLAESGRRQRHQRDDHHRVAPRPSRPGAEGRHAIVARSRCPSEARCRPA